MTTETTNTTGGERRQGSALERGVRRAGRTASVFVLRMVLVVPLILLRGVLSALSSALDSLATSLFRAERALRQATEFPYAKDIRDALAEAEEQDRLRLLRVLRDGLE